MSSIAAMAAQLCARNPLDMEDLARRTNIKPIWRRAPRTKSALALKAEAIEKAVRILEDASVTYTQPLFGKLVVEPPPMVQRGKRVTFWPARERLRVAQRPTRVGQGVHAFQQALADQGHRIPGYVSRRPRPSCSPKLARAECLRARREAELAEMEQAHAQLMDSLREMTEDLVAGRKVRRRDPRSARAKQLFRNARARAIG